MRKRACSVELAVLLVIAIPSHSLRAQPPLAESAVAMQPLADATPRPVPQKTTTITPGVRFASRLTLGTLGWVAGLYAAPYIGRALDNSGGIGGLYIGTLVGTVAGTGLGVGLVDLEDGCSTGSKIALGTIGAAAGTMGGIVAMPVTAGFSLPIGAIVLGAAVAGSCNPRS